MTAPAAHQGPQNPPRITVPIPTEGMRPLFAWRQAFRERGPENLTTRAVGLVLSLYANMATCKATPHQSRLAEELACSERTIRDHIRVLEEDGWVERKRESRGYSYQLVIPLPTNESPEGGSGSDRKEVPVTPEPDSGDTGRRLHRKEIPPEGDSGDTGTSFRCDRNELPVHIEKPRETERNRQSRASECEVDELMQRVDRETAGQIQLTAPMAEKLLDATDDDVELAAECFVDKWSGYGRAAPYKLVGWACKEAQKRIADRLNPARMSAAGTPNRLEVRDSEWSKSAEGQAFFNDVEEIQVDWGPDE